MKTYDQFNEAKNNQDDFKICSEILEKQFKIRDYDVHLKNGFYPNHVVNDNGYKDSNFICIEYKFKMQPNRSC